MIAQHDRRDRANFRSLAVVLPAFPLGWRRADAHVRPSLAFRWPVVCSALLCVVILAVFPLGCGTIDLPIGGDEGITIFPPGSFVIRGRMDLVDIAGGDCLVFRAETGINYHLFQSPTLENDLFDDVTTPGAISRLEVQARTDLDVACQIGQIVEVHEVLELVPAPGLGEAA